MTNKKRIRNLIKRKYKTGKIYPKISKHFSDAMYPSLSDFGIKADLLGSSAEKAAKSFLNFYNSIPKALLNPEQPCLISGGAFGGKTLSGSGSDKREAWTILCAGRYPGKNESLVDHILQKNIEEISKKHSATLSQYIRSNLQDFGFFFESENEFLDFVRDRITRISFSENVYHFEYYLDYVSEANRGVLIGVSNGKVKWSWSYEPYKVTLTIG